MKDFIIHDMEQRSQEWFDFREGKVGSSDAAAIMGVSPFKKKSEVWEQFAFSKNSNRSNKAMQRGISLEGEALKWANSNIEGSHYTPKVLQKISAPKIIASLDGYQTEHSSLPKILEIKCPGVQSHLEALGGNIPSYYFPQLQHQMMVAEEEVALYVSFDGKEGVCIKCYRDEEYIKRLIDEEMAFLDSVERLEPPKDVWQTIDDPRAKERAIRFLELQKSIKAQTKELEEIKGFFKKSLESPFSLIGDLKVSKTERKGSIDYESIPELIGVNLEKYRKNPVEVWRFY